MTLNELGSLGEFVGAIAVVISLIYLAIQIRHNTRAVQSGTHQAVLDGIMRVSASLSDSEGLAQIAQKANEDRESLTDEERVRFEAYADRTVAIYETDRSGARRSVRVSQTPSQRVRSAAALRRNPLYQANRSSA